jgi:hypothetical protein
MGTPINREDNANGLGLIFKIYNDPTIFSYSAPRGAIGVLESDSQVSIFQKQDEGATINWIKTASAASVAAAMAAHLAAFNHGDIALNTAARHSHANMTALNSLLKELDSSAIGDQKAIVYDLASDKWIYKTVGGGAIATSGVTNDSSVVGATCKDALNTLMAMGTTIITDKYYVDGQLGDDAAATLDPTRKFKTIQACLSAIGQPTGHIDAMRSIGIYISDNYSAIAGGTPATFDGCYPENLTVPCRKITIFGNGIKIGDNGSGLPTGVGNVLKEYSTGRRFGASSSEFRPCLTFVGLCNARDSHQRLRNGFHVAGSCRTSTIRRNLSSIQGDGVNHITVEVAAGQFYYPITVPTLPDPLIRINVNNTTNYNGNYDITTKIDDTHFIATRVSGTNANVGIETSGRFFESDSAGAAGMSHDSCFINTYMQGHLICDDGTINYPNDTIVPPTAGTEVLYAYGSRFYTGVTGRTILMQRWDNTTINSIGFTAGAFIKGATYTITAIGSTDFTLIGASSNTVGVIFTATGVGVGSGTALLNWQVSSISGLYFCSLSGAMTLEAAFTYSTDDMGLVLNRFNSAVVINCKAATTLRLDLITLKSFMSAGCTWVTNTPTLDILGLPWSGGLWASRPTTNLITGQMYYDTALLKPYFYNTATTSWYDAAGVIHV